VNKDFQAQAEKQVLQVWRGRQESLALVELPEVADYRAQVDYQEVPDFLARQE
jgi:hypothetical protein